MSSEISPHVCLPEPMLSFHADRKSDQDIHPLRGLLRFGLHSKGLVPDPIRVATIAPAAEADQLYAFMRNLGASFQLTERKDYLPEWPGFQTVFGARLTGAAVGCHIKLEASFDREVEAAESAHSVLADRLLRAIQELEGSRQEFDVIFICMPARWSRGFVVTCP